MDYLGGLGKAVGIRGGISGHGLLAPDGEQGLCRADTTAFHTALRWLKDAILRRGVTREAAVVALVPGVHPGLRLPDGDPPGAPHVPGQLAHGEHGRCLRAGEAQVAQKVPNRARQGAQGGLESPGLGGPAPATSSGHHGRRTGGPRGLDCPNSPSVPWPDHWAFKNPKGVAYCRDHHLHNKCLGSCGGSEGWVGV